jgi:hypothetical protein
MSGVTRLTFVGYPVLGKPVVDGLLQQRPAHVPVNATAEANPEFAAFRTPGVSGKTRGLEYPEPVFAA